MRTDRTILIPTPVLTRHEGAWRVSAGIDGTEVWLESPEMPLVPSPEAFASAFLVPSLQHRRRVVSETPLDATWLGNSPELVSIFGKWWRYPRLVPRAAAAPAPVAPPAAAPEGRLARGLFFSGGVDSFHALLSSEQPIDLLVFAAGLDVRLDDTARIASTLAGIRDVAATTGTRLVTLRTNLRDHPLVRTTSWERANGGALAAIAHVLGGAVEEMRIASSIAIQWERAWGSHWQTDPLFSSRTMRVREVGQELRRLDKVRAIAGHALPQKHLRVCWENRAAAGNCSKCGKCVITRLMLANCGMLDRYPGFEGTASLARDIDALRYDSHRNSLTDLVTLGTLDPELKRAATALLGRMDHADSLPVRSRRALLRRLRSWTAVLRRPGSASARR